ncbi:hypothetical protein HN587_01190 [Candidatus Woesearchaeota archaeon]|jgi:predicted translin family RNA/ssDNA-binding protein|nr:hypothetical protein [Candidatus Woesearchaeota archaeon]
MLDKKDLSKIKAQIEKFEKNRDIAISQGRDIVKMSKKVIYSVHRNNLSIAKKDIAVMTKKLKNLNNAIKLPQLKYAGSYKVAIQEYVEAVCFYEYVKNKRIPTNSELKFEPDHYLLGLIDLTGELVRRAFNCAIKEDYAESVEIKDFVSELYDELMQFDFSGGELRKKFDSVKYDLKKLEDLVLNLKMTDKI